MIGVFEIFLQTFQIFGFWVNYGVNIHIAADDDAQWHDQKCAYIDAKLLELRREIPRSR